MRKIFAALAILGAALALGLVATPASAVNPTLDFFLSAPSVQNTYVSGAEVETFNSTSGSTCPASWVTDSSTVIGTMTSNGCTAKNADQYGGATLNATGTVPSLPAASGTGSGTRYLSLGDSKTLTLTLATPENYLGFWWSAGDGTNTIKLYSGGTGGSLVGSFSTATILTMLSNPSVTALDNSSYTSSWYFGNPVLSGSSCTGSGKNCSEPYAYIHLIGSNGLAFDTVVFSQGTATGSFEFDNVAIARTAVTPDNSLVSFPPNLVAGNSTQAATTCSSFTSNIDWTASNFSSNPSYSVSPAMPAGLSFSSSTGEITGTPTAVSSSTTYTVTATAGAQSKTATFALAVTAGSSTACPTTTPAALPNTGTSALPGVIGVGILITGAAAIVAAVLLRRKRG